VGGTGGWVRAVRGVLRRRHHRVPPRTAIVAVAACRRSSAGHAGRCAAPAGRNAAPPPQGARTCRHAVPGRGVAAFGHLLARRKSGLAIRHPRRPGGVYGTSAGGAVGIGQCPALLARHPRRRHLPHGHRQPAVRHRHLLGPGDPSAPACGGYFRVAPWPQSETFLAGRAQRDRRAQPAHALHVRGHRRDAVPGVRHHDRFESPDLSRPVDVGLALGHGYRADQEQGERGGTRRRVGDVACAFGRDRAPAGTAEFRPSLFETGQCRRPQRGGGGDRGVPRRAGAAGRGGAGRQYRCVARHAASRHARRQPCDVGVRLCAAFRRIRQCLGKGALFPVGTRRRLPVLSGNLLWVESRRKRRQAQQGRAQINMARATVGICIGLCVAVSSAFVSAQGFEWLAQRRAIDSGSAIGWVCFATWGLCALWASLRPPIRAAQELLWVAAAVTLLAPIAHGLATGGWWWRSAGAGQWGLFCIDVGALAMAFGFAVLARATARRARAGEPNSVWSSQARARRS
jgi:hypothetical protein